MRVGRGTNVGGQTQLCWWADVIMLRNHYFTWFHIVQKFALFSHEGRNKDRFFKNTSHYNRRQTKTGLNAATHDLITNFFLEKFKKKMVDRHGGLKFKFKVFSYSFPIFCTIYIALKLVWNKTLSFYSWSKFLPQPTPTFFLPSYHYLPPTLLPPPLTQPYLLSTYSNLPPTYPCLPFYPYILPSPI